MERADRGHREGRGADIVALGNVRRLDRDSTARSRLRTLAAVNRPRPTAAWTALPSAPAHSRSGVDAALSLPWLIRLRWAAVVGQLVAVLIVPALLAIEVPTAALLWLIALTASTNLALSLYPTRAWANVDGVGPALLVLDTCTLTVMLALSGGAENPFCLIYFVHVALAAVIFGRPWQWLIAALACVGSGIITLVYIPLPRISAAAQHADQTLSRIASWVAFTLVALLVTFLLSRLTAALAQRELELTLARERSVRAARIATVTTLGAGAAHELGSPLGTIAVVAKELELALEKRLLRDETRADPAMRDLLEDAQLIRTELKRCRLILDRLSVERIDLALPVSSISIDALHNDIRESLGNSARRVALNSDLHEIRVPRQAALTGLLALLRNALLASDNDSEVTVNIRRESGKIIFEVSDKGAGMSVDVLARLGDPFFRARERADGMGLGVFLTELLAEQLGGSLSYASAPGEGTVATLIIPESLMANEAVELSALVSDAGAPLQTSAGDAPSGAPLRARTSQR